MKFEYPQFLYALFLLLIPIVIHLFNFRRYKTLYFSSLFFVRQINEETKSTQKLKHLLILLARIFAFSALIIAFCQPYKPVNQGQSGGHPFVGIYVDNSFSMSQKGAEGELLSMAKEKARSFIEKAESDTRFMLVTNNFEGFEQRLVTKNEALERLDKLDYSPLIKQTKEVLRFMKKGISEEIIGNVPFRSKQFVLLSDFQKKTVEIEEVPEDKNEFYYPIQLLAQQNTNLCIDSLWFEAPNFKVGINNELMVRVKNYGKSDLLNNELHMQINESKRDVFFDVKAHETVVIPITYTDLKPGFKQGKVSLNDKQVLFDDDFYFSYQVKEHASVLIIDAEDAVPNIALVYGLDDYYQKSSISANALTQESIKGKDLLVLNGWNGFSSGTTELFDDFLSEGGTIAVFPGQKLEQTQFNQWMQSLGGAKLGGTLSEGIKIKTIAYEDPFFKGIFERKPNSLNLPAFNKVYSVNQRSGLYPLISLQNGMPVFYRLNGKHNLFVFASSLSDGFSNFKGNALFSSILLRMAELSQKRYPLYITLGSESVFPLYDVPSGEEPIKLSNEEMEFIPESKVEQGTSYIGISKRSIAEKFKSGLYSIQKGNQKIGNLALNYQRAESDIEAIDLNELKSAFEQKGYKQVFTASMKDASDSALIKIQKPVEYWRIFVILALFFLLVEMSLLKWFK